MQEYFPLLPGTHPPKYVVGIFLIFIIVVFGLAFFQIRSSIYGAFDNYKGNTEAAKNADAEFLAAMAKLEEEQNKDTDKDGLSDYEEQFLYGTSPYLSDTDSDTFSDNVEVEKGSNPLCAEGTNCDTKEKESETPVAEPITPLEFLPQEKNGEVSFIPDGKELRNLLLQSGIPEEVLQSFSDENLEELFKKSYKDVSEAGQKTAQELEQKASDSPLKNFSSEEFQKILLEAQKNISGQ